MGHQLTASEELALRLISEWLGEPFHNRTLEECRAIAAKIPDLEAQHAHVKNRWKELWDNGYFDNRKIYVVHPSDGHNYYTNFPRTISKETIRTALVKSRWREFIEYCREASF